MLDAVAHRGGNLNLVLPTSLGARRFAKSPAEIDDDVLDAALGTLANDHMAFAERSRLGEQRVMNGV